MLNVKERAKFHMSKKDRVKFYISKRYPLVNTMYRIQAKDEKHKPSLYYRLMAKKLHLASRGKITKNGIIFIQHAKQFDRLIQTSKLVTAMLFLVLVVAIVCLVFGIHMISLISAISLMWLILLFITYRYGVKFQNITRKDMKEGD